MFPGIVKYLTKDNFQELELLADKNTNYLLLSYFLYPNSKTHVDKLQIHLIVDSKRCINDEVLRKIHKIAIEKYDNTYNDLIIYYFFNCQNSSIYKPDYDYINWTYDNTLKYFLPYFTQDQTNEFLKQLNSTYVQAHCFKDLVAQLKQIIADNHYAIDFTTYEIDISKY